jgi:peptide chain release factor 2
MLRELIREFESIDSEEKLKRFEIKTLLSGKYDSGAAVISLYAGAGGKDAEDWANMLFQMYVKYATSRGWKTKEIDDNAIEVSGSYAYGFLKGENGVHRLVRISPYDAKQLRHTSFALVEVLPELPEVEAQKLEIPEKDIKAEFFRSSGPGGQNVNKVETAVRLIHLPTSLAASSQVERSQARNRERAMNLLKTKIVKLMEVQKAKELGELKTKVKPEWGNQIRSYVLHPYKMVKDHRTGVETGDVDKVLGGGLDEFIEAELQLLTVSAKADD